MALSRREDKHRCQEAFLLGAYEECIGLALPLIEEQPTPVLLQWALISRERLGQWKLERDRREAELAQRVPELALAERLRRVSRQAVALALPADTALVEFVRFSPVDFSAIARGEAVHGGPRYFAFVLTRDGAVQMLDLGAAPGVDALVASFRRAVTGEAGDRGQRDLGAIPAATTEDWRGPGAALRAAVFDPLATALGTRRVAWLAPDGDLALVPFEVLPSDDGRCLIETWRLSYLGSGRDLLRLAASPTVGASRPLVLCDPDFDLRGDGAEAVKITANGVRRQSCDLDRSLRFGPLPGTRREGERIGELLGVSPWTGEAAVEGPLKECRSPRILHLATHGFFLADRADDSTPAQAEPAVPASNERRLTRAGQQENPACAPVWLSPASTPGSPEGSRGRPPKTGCSPPKTSPRSTSRTPSWWCYQRARPVSGRFAAVRGSSACGGPSCSPGRALWSSACGRCGTSRPSS